jgi:hypothetical protein
VTEQQAIKYWFETIREQGEYPFISIFEIPQKAAPREHEFFHGSFDGIGSMLELLSKRPDLPVLIPKVPTRKDPHPLIKFLAFLRYLFRLPLFSEEWALKSNWNSKTPEKPTARSFRVLSESETEEIGKRAKAAGVGKNAYYLFHLNRTLDPYHKETRSKRFWFIPVNLRSGEEKDSEGNYAGFFDAVISRKTSLQSLEKSMKERLHRGDAYAGRTALSFGRYTGILIWKFLIVINRYIQVRTGTFTNLGHWEIEEGKTHSIDWVGLPPVISYQPFGAMTVKLGKRQSLGIQFHPRLSRDQMLAEGVLQQWIASMLKE